MQAAGLRTTVRGGLDPTLKAAWTRGTSRQGDLRAGGSGRTHLPERPGDIGDGLGDVWGRPGDGHPGIEGGALADTGGPGRGFGSRPAAGQAENLSQTPCSLAVPSPLPLLQDPATVPLIQVWLSFYNQCQDSSLLTRGPQCSQRGGVCSGLQRPQ